MDPNRVFSIEEECVQGYNTISYEGRRYQIRPTETGFSFAKAKIEVQKHLDGSNHIFYKGEEFTFKRIIPIEHQ